MKDYCLALAARQNGLNAKRNAMREYLQAYLLRILHEAGVFRYAAFLGGTALRFLHDLPRFSEDLDFSLAHRQQVAFTELMDRIKRECAAAGYNVSVVYKGDKTVQSAFVKFAGLLHEAGISPLRSQILSVKIELDTRPPEGAAFDTRIVNKFFPIAFLSYDIPSLFSGKMHALLSRKYIKGRDFFDLGWYLSKWPDLEPNIQLLRNALAQTAWPGKSPDEKNWRTLLSTVVEKADWRKVNDDVEPFLERPNDMTVFTRENVLRLLDPGGKTTT